MIAGISWNNRDIIFARDFPWRNPGASAYSNNYNPLGNPFGRLNPANGQPLPQDPYVYALPGACDSLDGPFSSFTNQDAFGTTWQQCGYDFTAVSANEASLSNESAFVRAEHFINDDWTAYMDISVNKTESFGRYAPVPDSTAFWTGPISASSPNNPTNPNGYFGNQGLPNVPVDIYHRFDALGNRDNNITNNMNDVVIGANGYIGTSEVEFGLRETKNKVYDIGRNYLVRPIAFDYIETGAYDLTDPYGNPDSVLNSMKATISRISRYDQKEAFANVAFDAGALPAGPISWFVGAEYREEDYLDQYDSLSEAGAIGGSAGNTAGLYRDVSSVFFEGLMPLMDSLEMNIQGRYSDYSDYGSDFVPKLSFRFDATDDLVLRASYGQGFRAPTLDILSQKTTYSAEFTSDEQTCLVDQGTADCQTQVDTYVIANPNLDSEQSDQFSVGMAWAPYDWLNGTLDLWNIEIENRINYYGVAELIERNQTGEPIPSGLGVIRAGSGAIDEVYAGYGNEGTIDTSGLDLNIQANYDALGGRVSHELQGSYTYDYSVDGGRDQTGDPGFPRSRATLSNTYAFGDMSVAWNINYIGEQCDTMATVGYQNDPECQGKVPSWVTNDVQFNYFTPWDSRITVGAQNVGEKYPPIGKGFTDGRNYDFNLYNGYGRVVYARFTQTF
jgi:iron complex outermembrane receptor protein